MSGKVYSFKAVLQVKGGSRKTKAKDLAASLISSDVVEIAEVSQRAALGVCTIKVKGGVALPSLPCVGGASRVSLGSLVSLDLGITKNLDSQKQPEVKGQKLDGSFTFGTVAASLRYHIQAVDLQAGAAFLYEKVGYSPDRDEKERLEASDSEVDLIHATGSLQCSAGRLAVRYGGARLLAGVEALAGFSKTAASASGLNFASVLVHVGFDIKRTGSAP